MAVLFRSTLVSILSLLRYVCTKTDEVDPVYCAMKACKWSRFIAPLIPNLGTVLRGVVKCSPGRFAFRKETRYLLIGGGEGAGQAPALVWTLWRGEKSLATAGIRTPDR